jgi:hypothetical protein
VPKSSTARLTPRSRSGPAGRPQHPLAERHDGAGLLGEVDELGGHQQSTFRMGPAHQRLDGDDLPVTHVHPGLVVEDHLAGRDGPAQLGGAGTGVEVRGVHSQAASAGALGGVHRGVGVLEEEIAVRAGLVADRHADAGLNAEKVLAEDHRRPESLDEPLRHGGGRARGRQVL